MNKLNTSASSYVDVGPCKVRPKLEPAEYATSGMVRIFVGTEQIGFDIHKQLLFSQSPYCAALENFKGSGNLDHITLYKITIEHFKIIFNWLYTGKLISMEEMEKKDPDFTYHDWIGLYHSADILVMTNLQNAVVDADLSRGERRVPWSLWCCMTWHTYQLAHTPYYQLFMADAISYYFETGYYQVVFDDILERMKDKPEALFDLIRYMDKYRRQKWPKVNEGDWCRWHIHENGEKCG